MRTLGFPFWSEAGLALAFERLERVLRGARLLEFSWAPLPGESRRLVEALQPVLSRG
jgi:hypothetical protein